MSNPAVIVLSSGKIGRYNVAIEDNVGEAIHLHIDDIRIDFSYKEFKKLVTGAKRVIAEITSVEGFNCDDYDPVFLSSISKYLISLDKVERTKIMLEDIMVNQPKFFRHINPQPLQSSKNFKALHGDYKQINEYNSFDHIGQTGLERLEDIKESIDKNGYPHKGMLLVFFNDSNMIRDGQHRACVLLEKYGNIEIPIIRLYFKNDLLGFKNQQKRHYRKLRDYRYAINYLKTRAIQFINKYNNWKVNTWNKKQKHLIDEYENVDK